MVDKDTESILLGVSIKCVETHGYKNIDISIGTTDYDIPCKVSESADIFRSQDKEARQTRSIKNVIDIHEYYTGFAAVKSTKTPIINPATNNILGTFWLGRSLEMDINLKTILDVHRQRFGKQSSMEITNGSVVLKLTNLEQNVLFCICLGISSRKDITNLLSVIYKKELS